jgi:hypothetical protein
MRYFFWRFASSSSRSSRRSTFRQPLGCQRIIMAPFGYGLVRTLFKSITVTHSKQPNPVCCPR